MLAQQPYLCGQSVTDFWAGRVHMCDIHWLKLDKMGGNSPWGETAMSIIGQHWIKRAWGVDVPVWKIAHGQILNAATGAGTKF